MTPRFATIRLGKGAENSPLSPSTSPDSAADRGALPAPTAGKDEYRERLHGIKGWFGTLDFDVFVDVLDSQADVSGDLLEMGPFLGRSAVLIGYFRRRGENFVVCDLFGSAPDDEDNVRESHGYGNLTRAAFERNYRAWHPDLPSIVHAATGTLSRELKADSFRFVHIDGSHLYVHVAEDIRTAATLSVADAVIVCDDFRSPHTPGTAAAVWEAVADGVIYPFAVTRQKLYAAATKDAAGRYGEALKMSMRDRYQLTEESIMELSVLRLAPRKAPETRIPKSVGRRLPLRVQKVVHSLLIANWSLRWARDEPLLAAEAHQLIGTDLIGVASSAAGSKPRPRGVGKARGDVL